MRAFCAFMRLALAGVMVLALSACSAVQPLSLTAPGVTRAGWVALTVRPHYAGTIARKIQTEVPENTQDTIARLDIVPFVETGTSVFEPISALTGEATTLSDEHRVRLSQTGAIKFDAPFTLSRLRPNKRYRIYAMAYNADGALISTMDASSYVEVDLSTDDRPDFQAVLPVKLVPVPFSGQVHYDFSLYGSNRATKLNLTLCWQDDDLNLVPLATTSIARSALSTRRLGFANLKPNTSYVAVATPVDDDGTEYYMADGNNRLYFSLGSDDDGGAASVSIAVPYVASTIAGNDTQAVQDGYGTEASLSSAERIALDAHGTLYWLESDASIIRRMEADGHVTTLAGPVGLGRPTGLACAPDGTVYFTEEEGTVRKVAPDGSVTTIAGVSGAAVSQDGTGTEATFTKPVDLTYNPWDGNLYVVDGEGPYQVRCVTTSGVVTTVFSHGSARASSLRSDNAGNLYVVEMSGEYGHLYRYGLDDQSLAEINQVYWDSGDVFVDLAPDGRILLAGPDFVAAIQDGERMNYGPADGNSAGYADGDSPQFSGIRGLVTDSQGRIFVADSGNHRIRMLQ